MSARVHLAEGVPAASHDGEREGAQDHFPKPDPDTEGKDPGAWMGRIVQQLSGVWGESLERRECKSQEQKSAGHSQKLHVRTRFSRRASKVMR